MPWRLSSTCGYGTMDFEVVGYQKADLVRLDILVNGKQVDVLAIIYNREDAERRGRAVCKKRKQEISRQMFEVAVPASIGSRSIAREFVPAMRNNVTVKCYGGDISRKKRSCGRNKKRVKSV